MLAQQKISVHVNGLLKLFMQHHEVDAPNVLEMLSASNGEKNITYQQWWDCLEELRDASGIDHIGLILGSYITPEFSGILGYLGMSSLTLGDALGYFERYQTLLYGGEGANIERRGDNILCQWTPADGIVHKESDETLIAALVCFTRLLTGDESQNPARIGFMHAKPEDVSAYQTLFRCEVSFSCRSLYIETPVNQAGLPSKESNPTLGAILEQHAQVMLDELPSNENELLGKVRQTIKDAISAGVATQEQVAKNLGLSSRTLHRKLLEHGVQFNVLLQDIRYQIAKQYLDEGQLSISVIAHKMGYSEQSAFTRAFKKWSGVTPIAYAKGEQSTPGA